MSGTDDKKFLEEMVFQICTFGSVTFKTRIDRMGVVQSRSIIIPPEDDGRRPRALSKAGTE